MPKNANNQMHLFFYYLYHLPVAGHGNLKLIPADFFCEAGYTLTGRQSFSRVNIEINNNSHSYTYL